MTTLDALFHAVALLKLLLSYCVMDNDELSMSCMVKICMAASRHTVRRRMPVRDPEGRSPDCAGPAISASDVNFDTNIPCPYPLTLLLVVGLKRSCDEQLESWTATRTNKLYLQGCTAPFPPDTETGSGGRFLDSSPNSRLIGVLSESSAIHSNINPSANKVGQPSRLE